MKYALAEREQNQYKKRPTNVCWTDWLIIKLSSLCCWKKSFGAWLWNSLPPDTLSRFCRELKTFLFRQVIFLYF